MRNFGFLLLLILVFFAADGLACGSTAKTNSTVSSPKPAPSKPLPKDTISYGLLCGKAVSLVTPAYPSIAKRVKASGTVIVQVIVGKDGRVESAIVLSGHPFLQEAAEKAALASKFSPTNLSGKPVKVQGVIVYNFAW